MWTYIVFVVSFGLILVYLSNLFTKWFDAGTFKNVLVILISLFFSCIIAKAHSIYFPEETSTKTQVAKPAAPKSTEPRNIVEKTEKDVDTMVEQNTDKMDDQLNSESQ